MTGTISRADLLAYLEDHPQEELDTIADCFGFQTIAQVPTQKVQISKLFERPKPPKKVKKPAPKKVKKQLRPQENFYYLSAVTPSKLAPEIKQNETPKLPDFITKTSLEPKKEKRKAPILVQQDLLAWEKLWPVLRKILSETSQRKKLDIAKLVKIISNGSFPVKTPKQQRNHWAASTTLLIDYPERLKLFGHDYLNLQDSLSKMRGEIGLNVLQIKDYPGGQVTSGIGINKKTQNWKMPEMGEPILILSDAGLLDTTKSLFEDWLIFGRKLKQAGCISYLLTPLSPHYLPSELLNLFKCIQWDKQSNLQTLTIAKTDQKIREALKNDRQIISDIFLPCLSPALLVEPKFLRAVCQLLSQHELSHQQLSFDAGIQALCWTHLDVSFKTTGLSIHPDKIISYRNKLMELAQTKPNLMQPLYALFKQYHGHKYPSDFYEEILVLQATGKLKQDALIKQALDYIQQLIKSLYENPEGNSALRHYCYYLLQRQADKAKKQQKHWSSLWAILKLQLQDQLREEEAIPAWINMQMASPFLLQKGEETQWHVIQQGENLCLLSNEQTKAESDNDTLQANLTDVFQFSSPTSLLLDECLNNKQYNKKWEVFDHQLDPENRTQLSLNVALRRIHANGKAYMVSPIKKPDWAESIGQNNQGLYIEYRLAKQSYRSYWENPEIDKIGHWQGLPPAKIGRDQYGVYADLSLKNITQRFRYIEAGTFLMGSPENEAERESWGKETQHQVTLIQGFWMADTTVTQAFYHVVMSKNPSRFKESEENPVEEVSWDDAQIFIKKLNKLFPNLQAGLPTEAQWEYACRAGTTTPFSFGENITPEQVNYDGSRPYAGGDKGLYREKTVPVKSLPTNDWGLYEMHGNVWEWCEDAFKEDLGKQSVQDPLEVKGARRIVRGGSWFFSGRGVRSAQRGGNAPDVRFNGMGFRLLLGHLSYRQDMQDKKEPFEPQHEQMLRDETADHDEEQMAGSKVKKMLKNIKGIFKK